MDESTTPTPCCNVTAHAQHDAPVVPPAGEECALVVAELLSAYAFTYHIAPDGTASLAWISEAQTHLTGYTDAELRSCETWSALVHPLDSAIVGQRRRRLLAGQSDVSEYRLSAKDGRIIWVRVSSRPIWSDAGERVSRIHGVVQDITQIKLLEQQLIHSQKFAVIGRLASGIVHDFNNLLTVVLGSAEQLLVAGADAQLMREEVEHIHHAAERAAALIHLLLPSSPLQEQERLQLNLAQLVEHMQPLLRRLLGDDIQLVTQLAPDLAPVSAGLEQIEQVIMNLAINARDAMPTGGILTIAVSNGSETESEPGRKTGGPSVLLTVSDTGIGMDAATCTQIFEPFYTTKGIGKGTGLGLAIVQGVIHQYGGYIEVTSEPGVGTTFIIALPCAEPEEYDVDSTLALVARAGAA
jgi:PAS domain S-box-containing protein